MNKLAKRVKELEEKIKEWGNKDSFEEYVEEVVEAIKYFCTDCPLRDEYIECVSCYLHKWKDGIEE